MKIDKHKQNYVLDGAKKDIEFKITAEATGAVMEALISLYSDPLGSVIREITSNAVDAHRERDMKLAGERPLDPEDDVSFFSNRQSVEIEYVDENELTGVKQSLIIKDWGIGLSPTRVEDVYTVFGSSTKTGNNSEIGGFGLGSKSLFTYTDTVFIETVYNGIKYTWMISYGGSVPKAALTFEEETDEKNCVFIHIPLKMVDNKKRVSSIIQKQLAYFSNIHFSNLETIGIKKNFALTTEEVYIENLTMSKDSFGALVGRVLYPIDWDNSELQEALGDKQVYSMYLNYISGVLRFKIGEVDLIRSREALMYTEKTINCIVEKVQALKESLLLEIEKLTKDITNLRDYFKVSSVLNSIKNTYKGYSFNCNDLAEIGIHIFYDKLEIKVDDLPNSDKYAAIYSIVKKYKCFPYIDTTSFHYNNSSNTVSGKVIGTSKKELTPSEFSDTAAAYYQVENNFSTKKTAAILQESDSRSFNAFKFKEGHLLTSDFKFSNNKDFELPDNTTWKELAELIISEGLVIKSYDDVKELEIEESSFDILSPAELRKLNESVFYKRVIDNSAYSYGSVTPSSFVGFLTGEKKAIDLNQGTETIKLVGTQEDDEALKLAYIITRTLYGENRVSILKVAKNILPKLTSYKYVGKFFMEHTKELKLWALAYKLYTEDKTFQPDSFLRKLEPKLGDSWIELRNTLNKFGSSYRGYSNNTDFKDLVYKYVIESRLIDEEIESVINSYYEYLTKYPLISYIDFNSFSGNTETEAEAVEEINLYKAYKESLIPHQIVEEKVLEVEIDNQLNN